MTKTQDIIQKELINFLKEKSLRIDTYRLRTFSRTIFSDEKNEQYYTSSSFQENLTSFLNIDISDFHSSNDFSIYIEFIRYLNNKNNLTSVIINYLTNIQLSKNDDSYQYYYKQTALMLKDFSNLYFAFISSPKFISNNLSDIPELINNLSYQDKKEIILSGINLKAFQKQSFHNLLFAIAKKTLNSEDFNDIRSKFNIEEEYLNEDLLSQPVHKHVISFEIPFNKLNNILVSHSKSIHGQETQNFINSLTNSLRKTNDLKDKPDELKDLFFTCTSKKISNNELLMIQVIIDQYKPSHNIFVPTFLNQMISSFVTGNIRADSTEERILICVSNANSIIMHDKLSEEMNDYRPTKVHKL